MRLASIHLGGREQVAVVLEGGLLPLEGLGKRVGRAWACEMFELLESGGFYDLWAWVKGEEKVEEKGGLIAFSEVRFAPLVRRPRTIWGIGLNYAAHAADLAERTPDEEPASFMRPVSTLIGAGEEIWIPRQSEKTTGEAELGIVFGRRGENVSRKNWLEPVAGFTTLLDMTAEDILRKNPRYLTRAKSFNTFLSLGPVLVTPDEVEDVEKLKVATVLNGEVYAENTVANMKYPPSELVSFHSRVFPWQAGDVLSTGTPRAVQIKAGDVIECRIDGFAALKNPVRDLKVG